MAQAKANAETLLQFSNILRTNHDDILEVKQSMDGELKSFIWDDPVGQAFVARYYEDLKPIEAKLIPNLVAYCEFLDREAELISQFGEGTL